MADASDFGLGQAVVLLSAAVIAVPLFRRFGLGSVLGYLAAGLIIGILEAMTAGYLSSHYKDALPLIVLLSVLFIRPSGLFGSSAAGRLKKF